MDIIYNLPEIRKMLTDFYILTNSRIVLFDRNYQELYAFPDRLSGFCKCLRENETIQQKCKHDDFSHFELCKVNKTGISYTCHAGLFEVITPLIINETVIGFLMAGQIKADEFGSADFEKISKTLTSYGVDVHRLNHEFEQLSAAKPDKLEATKNLMQIYSAHICSSTLAVVDKSSLAFQIDNFVLENLTTDLSVNRLCEEFGFNKTSFYKVTNKLYGVPIMQHIKQLRIHKAKILLSNSNLKINEIAEEVGIFDYNYFTKIFRKEVNCTPREFRKNSIPTEKI